MDIPLLLGPSQAVSLGDDGSNLKDIVQILYMDGQVVYLVL